MTGKVLKLAVSNIAWTPDVADDAYAMLREHGATGLEIAPGILFPDLPDALSPPEDVLVAAKARAARYGLDLVSMQSLLFNVTGAALFEGDAARETLDRCLRKAIDLGARLGVPNLVFGSPKNRVVPEGMDPETADHIATDFFRSLGDYAAKRQLFFALEPNPAIYGTNFLNQLEDTFAFARRVDHEAITVNFDIGALHVNGEFGDLPRLFELSRTKVSHVHLSEPNLAPAPAQSDEAAWALAALDQQGYDRWVSIEMRASGAETLVALKGALERCRAAIEKSRLAPGGGSP